MLNLNKKYQMRTYRINRLAQLESLRIYSAEYADLINALVEPRTGGVSIICVQSVACSVPYNSANQTHTSSIFIFWNARCFSVEKHLITYTELT